MTIELSPENTAGSPSQLDADARDSVDTASTKHADANMRDTQTDSTEMSGNAAARNNQPTQRNIPRLAESLNKGQAKPAYSPLVLSGAARLLEFAIICISGFAVYFMYVIPTAGPMTVYYYAITGIAVAAIIIFQSLKIYTIDSFRSPVSQILILASGWMFVFLAALAAIFFLKRGVEFSRIWLLAWFISGFLALAANRVLLCALVVSLTRRGRLDRRAAIVGGGPAAERLLHELANQKNTDVKIYGIFDDRADYRTPEVVGGFPKLGDVDELVKFARHTRLDLVIFALPITAEKRILEMLKKLWVLPVDIRLAAHSNKLRFRPRSYSYIGAVPVLAIFDKPMADWDVVMKMAFDRIVGALCLLALLPVMLLTALAIKLDSKGPVFFEQKRHGFNNEEVEVYKFRSMYAETLDYAATNLVKKGDPRVTRIGRFIRKTSLDELPQLINVVFNGNLSLVGPRPHAIHAMAANKLYDDVVDGYFARHRVRPGMTGWA